MQFKMPMRCIFEDRFGIFQTVFLAAL